MSLAFHCECGAVATLLIIHKCTRKASLGCTGMRAVCDTHVAADIRGELEIAAWHGSDGKHVVSVRRAYGD